MIGRLDKIAQAVRVEGEGKYYELDAKQVTLRKKRTTTPAERERLQKHAANVLNL